MLCCVLPAVCCAACCVLHLSSNGGVVAVSAIWQSGGTCVLREKFSARNWWLDVAQYQCTATVYIGELWRYLLNSPVVAVEQKVVEEGKQKQAQGLKVVYYRPDQYNPYLLSGSKSESESNVCCWHLGGHALRVIAGNGLTGDAWPQVLQRFGIKRVVEHYGLTEMPAGPYINALNRFVRWLGFGFVGMWGLFVWFDLSDCSLAVVVCVFLC